MKEVKKTTKEIIEAYKLVKDAKLTKMEDADKFSVIKATKALKKVAVEFEDFDKDVREKLKGEEHKDMEERVKKWQEENKGKTLKELPKESIEEYAELNKYFEKYANKIEECLKEELDKEHELKFKHLNEEAMGKLIASNDFTVEQMMALGDMLED